jgi:hypothetical protein
VDELNPSLALVAEDVDVLAGARYLIVWQNEADIRGQMLDVYGEIGAGIAIQDSAALSVSSALVSTPDPFAPSHRPKNPARSAPISGRKTIAEYMPP